MPIRAATAHSSKHLTPAELIDRSDQCPVCLDRGPRRRVHPIQSDPDVWLLKCGRCRACSASHMPTPQCLDAYYGAYYDGKDLKVTFPDKRRFARHICRTLDEADLGDVVRILDFGGGDGSLAGAIARELLARRPGRRAVVLLVDYQPPAAEVAGEGISVSHVPTFEQIEGQYDLVVASAILEHVPEVHPVIRKLFASIAGRGYFYARTPFVAPFARVLPNLDLSYPGHVHDMGSGFWNRVTDIFSLDARYVSTRPSLVESLLRDDPLRTTAAYVLKLPAYVEGALSPAARKDRLWGLVGGWEVVLRRAP